MKNIYILLCSFLFFFGTALAQKIPGRIYFKNGTAIGENNLLNRKPSGHAFQSIQFEKKIYVLLRFDRIPVSEIRNALKTKGVDLADYLPDNAFLAEMPEDFEPAELKRLHVTGIFPIDKTVKISRALQMQQDAPLLGSDEVIAVSYFGSIDKSLVRQALEKIGAKIIINKIQPNHAFFISANLSMIHKIAALPFISYISKQSLQLVPLNNNNRAIHGVDAVSASSGRNLQGKNVTIGMGDNADPSTHIDFAGRLILRNSQPAIGHGTHTTGTAGGGGILNPKYRGMAPKSTLVSQAFNDVLVNAPLYMNDYNMVLTNNSYFQGLNNCPGEGEYDLLSNYIDSQLYANVSLLHVFASGNDGLLTCSPYPASFATIKSGYQTAKNALTVGAMDNLTYGTKSGSSRGPVGDGRIKPEMVAGGQNIVSTLPNNTYGPVSGTSMAAPTVTGALALMYERYRQLHAGANPPAALIKAVACNSADDLGNPGPDFTFGFGMLNARTAIEAIENSHYFSGSLIDGAIATHSIAAVPPGAYQLKIMLYWPDQPASAFASTTLVNDLDLTVTGSDATIHHPLLLDPSPAQVNNNAVEGIDHVNNIEQVVINNPPAGNFTITVKGTKIPFASQNYFIAYEVLMPSVTVEFPFGSNTLVPGETENIRWSSYGEAGNTFKIEYSADNGSSWNLITNSVPSTSRLLNWTVPPTATNLGLIRVTTNNLGYSDVSDYNFTIIQQPSLIVTNPCPGYAQLTWNSIASASLYEIMLLKGDSMQTVTSTTDTSFLLDGLNKDSSYWIGVRAVNNTTAGRRSISANIIPANGACTLPVFNNDMTVNAIASPVTGRQFTSSQLGTNPVKVNLKNLGSVDATGTFNISYQINSGTVTTESTTQTIPAASVYQYTFTQQFDFSAAGTYIIKAWVSFPGDANHNNDTIVAKVKQLQNDPLVLSPAFTEDFETAMPLAYTVQTRGLEGLDRSDFTNTPNGRLRFFVNTGFSRSGSRAATLDQAVYNAATAADSLITTFNLSGYSATDQIWLDYYYKKQLLSFNKPGNAVWIRGNDQAAWVFADSIYPKPSDPFTYRSGKSIDVTGLLSNAAPTQNISSSFQVKFGEEGFGQANDVNPIGYLDAGLSFDDITLTKSSNDLGLLSILQPDLTNLCALSAAEPVGVQVKNYSANTLTNISISYSLNGSLVTENIPAMTPGQSITYTFLQRADLSAYQDYNLRAWVHYSADNYSRNDSLDILSFHTVPVISSFPYLEGFESNNGYWYSNGINDSWQWGIPAKSVINRAANGTHAWVTGLLGNYNDNELSYLYSPCFDLSGLNKPVLSFSHIFQMEDDCVCDDHWVEYSTDNIHWTSLDSTGGGTNWYDDTVNKAWRKSYTTWHVSSHDIPVKNTKLRFRFVVQSDPATNFEGVGIDDIHVFDKAPVYDSSNILAGLGQTLSGNGWIHFDVAGKRIASINPNGQNLGNTDVKVYINKAAIRDTNNQYYLDRNIVIQPSIQPSSYVAVRYYFTDSEAVRLVHAAGCSNCTTIADAYLSGVTQYGSKLLTEEDSTLDNNINGSYTFYKPQQDVAIIPYDNGYYAEYNVYSFSEFWINGGGPGQDQALPIVLDSFTVVRVDTTGLLQWLLFNGSVADSFIVQKSTDASNFSQTIASIKADSTVQAYQYTDKQLVNGLNYYRIKIIQQDGHYQYSPIRNITYSKTNTPTFNAVFPNPIGSGPLYVNTVSNCNRIELYDVLGRFVRAENKTGLQNTFNVANLVKGVYILRVRTDAGSFISKVVVN